MDLKPYIEIRYWKDIRGLVVKFDPEFAKLVDEIDPKYPFFLVKYRYGDVLLDDGKFCLPDPKTGELIHHLDPRIPANVREALSYAKQELPAGIVLNGSFEILEKSRASFLPHFAYARGNLFALWKHLGANIYHPTKFFHVTAGSILSFMLPNIGELRHHELLCKEYNLSALPLPKTISDQTKTFVMLSRVPAAKCDWSLETLFFPKKWVEELNNSNDTKWLRLRCLLYSRAWKQTDLWRNKVHIDHAFSCAQAYRNLRPNPYVADTAKHLVMIALGMYPAFAPAINDNLAPISFIQKTYLDIYGLKNLAPTIMQPIYFSVSASNRPGYYSLSYPTTMEFSPKCRKRHNNMFDCKELKHVINRFVEEIVNDKLRLGGTPIKEIIEKTQFDYFHNCADKYGEILSSRTLPEFDPLLIKCPPGYENEKFAYSCTFMRGGVRISSKK